MEKSLENLMEKFVEIAKIFLLLFAFVIYRLIILFNGNSKTSCFFSMSND